MYTIAGHHHVSMITKNANDNNYFYTKVMGLRRVKMTVNQDDPSMYHLFYGDEIGSPGTELTFFEIPMAGSTHRGTNAITRIGLIVPSEEALTYWKKRLTEHGVEHGEITTYANRPALHFSDDDELELVIQVADKPESFNWRPWEGSSVPEEFQIRGIGTVEFTVKRPEKMDRTLTELFHYEEVARLTEEKSTIYQSQLGDPFSEILVREKDGERERAGRGSTHHIAIRVKDTAELIYWEKVIKEHGFRPTEIVDRYYFHSLYFRESNGIMFELATDGPGFIIDGPSETLGRQLDLPPFLEPKRDEIVAKLVPIEE